MITFKMFNKKSCKKCGEKINSKYNFCPHCSSPLNTGTEKEDWGMLGKSDFDNDFNSLSNNLFGGISGGMLNKMLSSALKILEKEMKKEVKNQNFQPKTNIRRFSDKIIYEIEMPGVKSQEDISIIKLESSVEIKAVGKNKAYLKLIPINFPITKYDLSNGKLVLELNVKN